MPVLFFIVLNMYLYFLFRVMRFTSLETKTRLQLMFQNTWPRSLQVFFLTLTLGDHWCSPLIVCLHVCTCIDKQSLLHVGPTGPCFRLQ